MIIYKCLSYASHVPSLLFNLVHILSKVTVFYISINLVFLEQLEEDLKALLIWVFNNGISHSEQANISDIFPYVQDALDGIEFARGSPTSRWGSVRASMGHPTPLDLRYVTVGNEDCKNKVIPIYKGSYHHFYDAIRNAYPDIQIISNCDASYKALDHPTDLHDYPVRYNIQQFKQFKG
ncbi:alpha-L-arabinofuranosidase 2-like [Vicia villosa]|uniref:alpha-L-arabinofuranosidase 2-like n=1 Tax=Vicia villosa TaxID=3911 RepID=UPI00273C2384|nr:alpha-L-arabinofuranosidase 2-like [Vicia villosa]